MDFDVGEEEFLVILGNSGSGKTTLLRCIAGLESPEEGYIEVGGEVWLDTKRGINLPPQKRGIGFVFQDYALFPNMTVLENILYGMKKRDRVYVIELLKRFGMEALWDKKPDKLSGGQKQRVALLRALVSNPKLLLLDEPLSALDPDLRLNLQKELKDFQKRACITAIMVSHDREEAIRTGDRVVIIQNGKIVEGGKPYKVLTSGQPLLIEKRKDKDRILIILKLDGGFLEVELPKEEL
ncbi:MAG: ABC transporter ATP-binding protein [Aquificaceae bacterium]|nr:ABC transporter ATP-binding protein [Aquificaceae bacterium]